ncbi:MAG TPA: hypothetical protein VHW09_27495 [Bryobacteraceae bacterium]|jgi:hypothetical protein|nr:hypothetical protein [Bryobacteraceae bacterium]
MKRIAKVVLSIAALAALTIGAGYAQAKSCCPNSPCCNGSCCRTHHAK